jgi:2,3-bisphosphoglycerate-independent phosphoglycerate mutase
MNQSRKDILDLFKEGKITAEEAEMLLDALGTEEKKIQDTMVIPKKTGRKMLYILVKSKDGDDVKIQVPIEFAKFMKFAKLDPKLQQQNIDFDELIKLVEDGMEGDLVNITSADGDIVRIVVQ